MDLMKTPQFFVDRQKAVKSVESGVWQGPLTKLAQKSVDFANGHVTFEAANKYARRIELQREAELAIIDGTPVADAYSKFAAHYPDSALAMLANLTNEEKK